MGYGEKTPLDLLVHGGARSDITARIEGERIGLGGESKRGLQKEAARLLEVAANSGGLGGAVEVASALQANLAVAGEGFRQVGRRLWKRSELVDDGLGLRFAKGALDGGRVEDVDFEDGCTQFCEVLLA